RHSEITEMIRPDTIYECFDKRIRVASGRSVSAHFNELADLNGKQGVACVMFGDCFGLGFRMFAESDERHSRLHLLVSNLGLSRVHILPVTNRAEVNGEDTRLEPERWSARKQA